MNAALHSALSLGDEDHRRGGGELQQQPGRSPLRLHYYWRARVEATPSLRARGALLLWCSAAAPRRPRRFRTTLHSPGLGGVSGAFFKIRRRRRREATRLNARSKTSDIFVFLCFCVFVLRGGG